MTVNRSSFESDKPIGTVSKTVQNTGNDSRTQQESNNNAAHSVELDTYFSDERIHIPDRVSDLFVIIH